MNVSLTPHLERSIREKVESGRYRSASEVVRAALRLLEEEEKDYERWRQDVREKIEEGFASIERGNLIPGEQAFKELLAGLPEIPDED